MGNVAGCSPLLAQQGLTVWRKTTSGGVTSVLAEGTDYFDQGGGRFVFAAGLATGESLSWAGAPPVSIAIA